MALLTPKLETTLFAGKMGVPRSYRKILMGVPRSSRKILLNQMRCNQILQNSLII
jgi:hypothetical protein